MENTLNKPAYQALRQADFNEDKAMAIAGHIPDWSQFATKSDIKDLEARLIRWMAGILLTFLTVIGSLIFGMLSWLGNSIG